MRRIEKKLLEIGDELDRLRVEADQVDAELSYLRHISDDAIRDAAVSEMPLDRREAGRTLADVARFGKRLEAIRARQERLAMRRDSLAARLN